MEADTTLFQASNGRQPRGFGRWGFQVGSETLFIIGQYSNSKQEAFKIAQTMGESELLCCRVKNWPPRAGTLRGQKPKL
jgi:hypothetical protein